MEIGQEDRVIGCRPKRETALPPTQSELRASYNLTMLNLYVSCSSVAPPRPRRLLAKLILKFRTVPACRPSALSIRNILVTVPHRRLHLSVLWFKSRLY